MALNKKQLTFVQEYLVSLNATQAAIKAGYSEKTAKSIGQRLLTKVDVEKAIQKAMDSRSKRTEITQDRVLEYYAKLAFFDVRKLYNKDGTLKPVHELDKDSACCIAGIETLDTFDREGNHSGTVKKVKLPDRRAVLADLGKHLGMFNNKPGSEDNPFIVEHNISPEVAASIAFLKGDFAG